MEPAAVMANASAVRATDLVELQQERMRAAAHDPKKARAAAEDFEAFFLGQFATLMFGNLGQGDYFSGGPAEGIYRSMLAEEIGKTAARSGGVGIADAVYREILNMQETAKP